jgi:transcriptional antiterminator NusG
VDYKWYIVHTYSGFEKKVKASVLERARSHGLAEFFDEVLVPTEKVVEMVKGQKRESERKFFPGYILVRMVLTDETWHLVKDTPQVTDFLGTGEGPTAIGDADANRIKSQMEEGIKAPKPKFRFEEGDEIRVIDGPFTNFNGIVEEVKPEKGKIKVLISIFGRSTPVELEFVQVTKI